jgi:hypothetical protein
MPAVDRQNVPSGRGAVMRYRTVLLIQIGLILAVCVPTVLPLLSKWVNRGHRVAPTHVQPRPFDHAGWASGGAKLRHGMARHMIASGELIGLSEEDITARLGLPGGWSSETCLRWYLGKRQSGASMMWDYEEYLAVILDERGVCTGAAIDSRD